MQPPMGIGDESWISAMSALECETILLELRTVPEPGVLEPAQTSTAPRVTQCAAVTTQVEETRLPPQTILVLPGLARPTCHFQ